MDNWDDDYGFKEDASSSESRRKQSSSSVTTLNGGWHWVMTLVCLITVTALSFLMAWLTRDTINRPFWMIGAIFTVPTLGMFAAAMLVEQKTSAMTPITSRKAQYLVALAAIIATFAVGCICDLLYQQGTMDQVIRNWAEAHPPEKVYSDIVLMVDKSSSLAKNGMDAENRRVINSWLDDMEDKARVGVIAFNRGVLQETPIDSLSVNRRQIEKALAQPTGSVTDFDISLYHAFCLVDAAQSTKTSDRATQIIAITDAEAELPAEVMEGYIQLCKNKNVVFSIVHLGHDVSSNNPLMKLASSSGGTGTSIGVSDLSQYFEGVQNAEEPDWNAYYAELKTKGEVDFDLIRVSDPEANLLCGIMLGLEGLSIGLCLMLMLSVTGQKRLQPVISVAMAAAAFVLLKILGPGMGPLGGESRLDLPQWLLEWLAFSLLGIVFMTKNNQGMKPSDSRVKRPSSTSIKPDEFDRTASSPDSGGGADVSEWDI